MKFLKKWEKNYYKVGLCYNKHVYVYEYKYLECNVPLMKSKKG